EVFLLMGSLVTSIIERPRPLSQHRRAQPHYTLDCEEPLLALIHRCRSALVDMDDTIRGVYGHKKQAATFSCSGVREPNAIVATAHTDTTARVVLESQRRHGIIRSGDNTDHKVMLARPCSERHGRPERKSELVDNHTVSELTGRVRYKHR